MMELFFFSFLSLCNFLDPFQFDPLLFFHMFFIFLEMRANWSSLFDPSSLNSSLGMSTLTALDELLDTCLDEDSLGVEDALAFYVVRAKDFPFLIPSSCWSFCSWTFKVLISSSMDMKFRFFTVLNVVICGFHFLDKLRILSMLS